MIVLVYGSVCKEILGGQSTPSKNLHTEECQVRAFFLRLGFNAIGTTSFPGGYLGCRLPLKEGAQGADHFHGEDDHIDQQDTEEHHHGIFLHLLRALPCLFL